MKEQIFLRPIEGIPIVEPEYGPLPGEILLGYKIIYGDNAPLFVKPKPDRMSTLGWICVILGVIIFWPLSCIPCCLSYSYTECQVPVYGEPYYNLRVNNNELTTVNGITTINELKVIPEICNNSELKD